jgi:putative sigma-54 modulation protein
MKIIIKTKGISLNEELSDFIEEKIGSIKKFVSVLQKEEAGKGKSLSEAFVEIEKETRHHQTGPFFRAEVQLPLPGRSLRAEAKSEDIRMAIVKVKDELQQEIKRYKSRKIDLERRGARSIKKKFHIASQARFK